MTLQTTRPLLSIVIPTKDRYETLRPTVDALLDNIIGASYEIIIQDNSDGSNDAQSYFGYHPDKRVLYQHISEPISMAENTEVALSRACGEYITFIGDDDLIAPNILDFVRYFSNNDIEAAIYPAAYYWWPSVQFLNPTRYHRPGAFWYPHSTIGNDFKIDTAAEMRRVASHGAVALFDLPRIYHGVVNRSVLEKIKKQTGYYVNGASPDMALAFAAGIVVNSHVKVSTPLTIYGASRNSGGGRSAARRHFGDLAEQHHLPQYTRDRWSERLPRIWSEHTIYPQTVMEVMRAMRRPDTLNYGAFYASMLINEPHLMRYVLPHVGRFLARNPLQSLDFGAILMKKFAGRLMRALQSRATGLPFTLSFFETPGSCMKYLATICKTDT